jgi:hypothetical protein
LQQWDQEKDVEIKFLILDTLIGLDAKISLKLAREILRNPGSDAYPAALNVLIQCGEPAEKSVSIAAIQALISQNSAAKTAAAHMIGHLQLMQFDQALAVLIADTDTAVSSAAITAAAQCHFLNLTPDILAQVTRGPKIYIINAAIAKLGTATIPMIREAFIHSKNPALLIKILASLSGEQHEHALLSLYQTADFFLQTILAKEISLNACNQRVSPAFKNQANALALSGTYSLAYLKNLLIEHASPIIKAEILSRMHLLKRNILYWLAVATEARPINNLIPALMKASATSSYQQAQAKAIELLEIYTQDKKLLARIINIFEPDDSVKLLQTQHTTYADAWLNRVIASQTTLNKGEDMDLLSKVFDLRGVELFKDLPSEILLSIAEETERISYNEGEIIFAAGDAPNGLYCISSGSVRVEFKGKILNVLQAHAYFGELALIDDASRTASVIADSDCSLLLLNKDTFDRITDDLPEVLRVVTKVILRYLRQRSETQN